jgi:hypothetical protein
MRKRRDAKKYRHVDIWRCHCDSEPAALLTEFRCQAHLDAADYIPCINT